MDQARRKATFEVRTLCLAAAVLLLGNMGAGSAAEYVTPDATNNSVYLGHTVPEVTPESVPWVTELTGYQIDFIERAMRELRARRPDDWRLYQIKIGQFVGSLTILVAQDPDEPNGPHTLTIEVDQVRSGITVTEGASDLIRP